jgi:hypothetical protein
MRRMTLPYYKHATARHNSNRSDHNDDWLQAPESTELNCLEVNMRDVTPLVIGLPLLPGCALSQGSCALR